MRIRFAILAAAAAAVSTAWAISPHFISATGTVNTDGALVVAFKEAGLGDDVPINYTLATQAAASYQCFNSGNNAPQGQPYQVPDQSITATAQFNSGKNGQVNGSLTAGPPDPAPAEAVLKCVSSGNKKLCLMSVSYSGSTLSESPYGDSIAVTPDPTDRSFPVPTKRNPDPPSCFTSF
jgi:hypothetical protein